MMTEGKRAFLETIVLLVKHYTSLTALDRAQYQSSVLAFSALHQRWCRVFHAFSGICVPFCAIFQVIKTTPYI